MFAGTSWDNATAGGNIFFVDGDNGDDTWDGHSPDTPKLTIAGAISAASRGAVIYIKPRAMASDASDPVAYAETVTIPAAKDCLQLIGVMTGQTLGGMPQLKIGGGSTAMITVNAAGCSVRNLEINGASSSGGGISVAGGAFGFSCYNCCFKNCRGSAAASTGGAIVFDSVWNVLVKDCRFHKNRCGILFNATTGHCENVVIQNCVFGANAVTEVDAHIYGNPVRNIQIVDCRFTDSDVPAYETSPDAAKYIKFVVAGATDGFGSIASCTFGCVGKTFGNGNALVCATTVSMNACFQKVAAGTGATGEIGITA